LSIILLSACFVTGCSVSMTWPLAVAPNGQMTAAGQNRSRMVLYDTETLQEKGSLDALRDTSSDEQRPRSLVFSPDGTHLAAAVPNDTVVVWNVSSGREVLRLSPMKAVAFSPDGKTLALAGPGNEGRLIRFPGGEELAVFKGHKKELSSVAFSPGGKLLATGSWDGTVRLWDVLKVKAVAVCPGFSPVTGLSFSRDGRTLASVTLLNAMLWQTASGGRFEQFAEPGYDSGFRKVVFEGSELLSLADTLADPMLMAKASPFASSAPFFTDRSAYLRERSYEHTTYSRIGYSPDGRFLAFLSYGFLKIIEVEPGKKIFEGYNLYDFDFLPDGKILVTKGFGMMLLDPESGAIVNKQLRERSIGPSN